MDWEQLFHRLAADANDAAAWDGLERRVTVWARRLFWKRGHHLVEDLVADTCAAVALGFDAARGPETFAGFVYGHFLNARRRLLRSGLPSGLPLGTYDVSAPTADDDGPAPETIARLRQALDALPVRERRAVIMRYILESSSAGIAAELGVTSGNARRILFNGLVHLRAQLGQHASWREIEGEPSREADAVLV